MAGNSWYDVRVPPRCYPPDPQIPPERHGERTVWQALREQLPDECVLFHSVGLTERGEEREADLVVAWPRLGLAVIEVKGGRVTREAGQWWQESHRQRRAIDPVVQAQDAKHALTRYLAQRGMKGLKAAHLVVFPLTAVPAEWEAPDCPRDCVVAKNDLADAA